MNWHVIWFDSLFFYQPVVSNSACLPTNNVSNVILLCDSITIPNNK